MIKDITITFKNLEFPDDFYPPEYFDMLSSNNNCIGCPFLFPGEDWVPSFCQLNINPKEYDYHPCPLVEQEIFKHNKENK